MNRLTRTMCLALTALTRLEALEERLAPGIRHDRPRPKPKGGIAMSNVARRLAAVCCAALVLVALLSAPEEAQAQGPAVPGPSFVVLLKGIYQPVVEGPDLGLPQVNLRDGSYSKTQIYRVSGINGLSGTSDQAIGTFYFSAGATRCAYQLPGGTFTAAFTKLVNTEVKSGGQNFWIGTAELVISQATGIYQSFVGGPIHMEFKTHLIDAATFDEYCICFISR
jgi:hypothetical protein